MIHIQAKDPKARPPLKCCHASVTSQSPGAQRFDLESTNLLTKGLLNAPIRLTPNPITRWLLHKQKHSSPHIVESPQNRHKSNALPFYRKLQRQYDR